MSLTSTISSWPSVEGRGQDVLGLLAQPGEDLARTRAPPGPACRAGRRGRGPRRPRCSSSRTAASTRAWSNGRDASARSSRSTPAGVTHAGRPRPGVSSPAGADAVRRPGDPEPSAGLVRRADVAGPLSARQLGGRQHRRPVADGARSLGQPDRRGAARLRDRREDLGELRRLSSVSFSSSSSTRWSRTSRFSTRIVPGLVVRVLDAACAPPRRRRRRPPRSSRAGGPCRGRGRPRRRPGRA